MASEGKRFEYHVVRRLEEEVGWECERNGWGSSSLPVSPCS